MLRLIRHVGPPASASVALGAALIAIMLSACSQAPTGPGFTLTAAGSAVSVAPGASASLVLELTPQGATASTITLSLLDGQGKPATGFAVTPGHIDVSGGQATLVSVTLAAGAGTATGSYALELQASGASGSVDLPLQVTVDVNATPDFTLAASPTALSSTLAGSVTTTVMVAPQNGFTGTVALALLDASGGIATGVTLTPSSVRITDAGSAVQQLTIQVGSGIPVGTYNLALRAGDGVIHHSVPLTLAVRIGNFLPYTTIATGAGPTYMTSADLNGDGKLDLVTTNNGTTTAQPTISVLLGNGDGTFQPHADIPMGAALGGVAAADLNGDGKLDLIVCEATVSGNVAVLLGNGDGTFQAPKTYPTGSSPQAVAVRDLNGDGNLDVITGNDGTGSDVSVLLGNGDGTLQTALGFGAQYYANNMTVADINNDGRPDVITTTYGSANSSWASVYLGNGDGTFQAPTRVTVDGTADSIAAGDVNDDGAVDLVVNNHGPTGRISVYLGHGDGTFGAGTPLSTDPYPSSVRLADVNEDGKLDIVAAASNTTGLVDLSLGNGDGTFQPVTAIPAGGETDSVLAVDLNGDGKLDVLATAYFSSSLSLLLGQ